MVHCFRACSRLLDDDCCCKNASGNDQCADNSCRGANVKTVLVSCPEIPSTRKIPGCSSTFVHNRLGGGTSFLVFVAGVGGILLLLLVCGVTGRVVDRDGVDGNGGALGVDQVGVLLCSVAKGLDDG